MKTRILIFSLFAMMNMARGSTSSKNTEFLKFIDETNSKLEKPYQLEVRFIPTEETTIEKISALFKEKLAILNKEESESVFQTVFHADSQLEATKANLSKVKALLAELDEVLQKSDHVLKVSKAKGVGLDIYRSIRIDVLRVFLLRIYVDIVEKNDRRLKGDLAGFLNLAKIYEEESNNLISAIVLYIQTGNLLREISNTKLTVSQKNILTQNLKSFLQPFFARDEREQLRSKLINGFFSMNYSYWMDFTKETPVSFNAILENINVSAKENELSDLDSLKTYYRKNPIEGHFSDILVPILFNETIPAISIKSNTPIQNFVSALKRLETMEEVDFTNAKAEMRSQFLAQLWEELDQKGQMDLPRWKTLVDSILNDTEVRTKAKAALLKSDNLHFYLFFMLQDSLDVGYYYGAFGKILTKKYLLEKRFKNFLKK